MQNSHGKRSQKIWTEIVFSKRSRKNNLQPFSWGDDSPFPSLLTLEVPMRIFLALCLCQARPASSLQQRADVRFPILSLSPWPPLRIAAHACVGWPSCSDLPQGRNNSSGKLFTPSVPLQVARSNGAKTRQTKVQSVEAQNRNKTTPTVTTERRKSCTDLIARRAKRGVIFVPGTAEFAYDSLWVYQAFSLRKEVNKHF